LTPDEPEWCLTEHIIALDALDKGLMGTLLRYPYEVRSEAEYFDEIQDVKVTKTCSTLPSIS
jgi:non-homologous end joining protein Ku